MLRQNLTFAIRSLRQSPSYSLTAIAWLAIGIGGAVGMFAIVHAVLLRELPFPEPQRLVRVLGMGPRGAMGYGEWGLTPKQLETWREGTRSLASIALVRPSVANLTGIAESQRVDTLRVSAEFFSTLGLQPLRGAWLTREDEQPGRPTRAVLTAHLWQQAYGADPAIVGKKIYLDGVAAEVAAVAPEFLMPYDTGSTAGGGARIRPSVFLPVRFAAWEREQLATFYYGVARLAPGVTARQAQDELDATMATMTFAGQVSRFPGRISVESLHTWLTAESRPLLLLLLGAVLCLLLIVCVNLANLSYVRWTRSVRDMAVRLALGASRRQLIGLCLTESAMLASIGTLCGLLLAMWGVDVMRSRAHLAVPRLAESSLSEGVLLFAAALMVATTLLVGILPAWRISQGVTAVSLRSNQPRVYGRQGEPKPAAGAGGRAGGPGVCAAGRSGALPHQSLSALGCAAGACRQ